MDLVGLVLEWLDCIEYSNGLPTIDLYDNIDAFFKGWPQVHRILLNTANSVKFKE